MPHNPVNYSTVDMREGDKHRLTVMLFNRYAASSGCLVMHRRLSLEFIFVSMALNIDVMVCCEDFSFYWSYLF